MQVLPEKPRSQKHEPSSGVHTVCCNDCPQSTLCCAAAAWGLGRREHDGRRPQRSSKSDGAAAARQSPQSCKRRGVLGLGIYVLPYSGRAPRSAARSRTSAGRQ